MKSNRWGSRIVVVLAVLFAGIQFVPVDRSNPPVSAEIDAPDDVLALLRRSCYDCHSFETNWPWYSKVAPVSWLVAHDVEEGREHLNFSRWSGLEARKREHALEEIWEEVSEGAMPLPNYRRLHPEAELSPADLSLLHDWTSSGEGRASSEDPR